MSRGEFAIIAGVVLCAIGVGLWIHAGAGFVVAGLGLASFGAVELRFPEEAETPTSIELAAGEERVA